ncbi:MAG: HAD-IIIA family hydrolase [Oligoflexia bacterium]|nr:HAD-IIIA family hydrolase [Oligoflexia bacterium]MBF0366297.1 HAD-IIIA family hydrolase [Oligoflexia bacterium]
MSRPAIFFDRDGVLIESIVREGKPFAATMRSEVKFIASAASVCAHFKSAGFILIMFTNQPDVARKKANAAEVLQINEMVKHELHLDGYYCCTHDDVDRCECRKPLPGMLKMGERDFDIDLTKSFVIGDRTKDMQAGKAVGATTIFIDYGYRGESEGQAVGRDFVVKSLHEVVKIITKIE